MVEGSGDDTSDGGRADEGQGASPPHLAGAPEEPLGAGEGPGLEAA